MEGVEEEMAVLARTGKAAREMLEYMAHAAAFFLVGLGVVGGALIGVGVARLVGVEPLALAGFGASLGLVAALAVYASIARRLPQRRREGGWRCLALLTATIVLGQMLVGLAGPRAVEVGWFPVIGFVFLAASRLCGGAPWLGWAGLGMLVASPLVLLAGDWYLAVGLMALVFMVVGGWLLHRVLDGLSWA